MGWRMNGLSFSKERNGYPKDGLKATLEKKYIEEYLHSRGYRRKDLKKLTTEVARQLMIEASIYASLKLADIESRSHFRKIIHGSS
jgi:hypothetical protein